MQTLPRPAALLVGLFTAAASAQAIDAEEAGRHGFQRLPQVAPSAGVPGAARAAEVYVKVLDGGRAMSLVDTGAPAGRPQASLSIVGFDIDCPQSALRYRWAEVLDPPWNPRGARVPVQGVWHRPAQDAVTARALRFACKG